MRHVSVILLAIACAILIGCSAHHPEQNKADTPQTITRLVVEDETGAIVKHDVLPGLARDFAKTAEQEGTDVVVVIAPEMQELLKEKFNAMLTSTDHRRTSVDRAIRKGQLTCHTAFEADGVFSGVGSRCFNALVYRVDPKQPVALMMNRKAGTAGMTPEAIRIAAEREANPGADCVNSNPRVIVWERVYPLLRAQVVPIDDPETGGTKIAYCSGNNRLDELPAESRDPDAEAAARSALIRLRSDEETRGPSGVLLQQYLHNREKFPDNWLQDDEVLTMLTPLLLEELGRCKVDLQIGSEVFRASGV